MNLKIFDSGLSLAKTAADDVANYIREAISKRGHAYLIAATGTSQFQFLDALVLQPGIEWKQTTFFHLDEYVGLPETHPASFRKYLRERILDRVNPGVFHFINGDAAPESECDRLGKLISTQQIDAAFVGIGENGHLAFNDPPADFETAKPYLVVELDEKCRKQQVGEGWFSTADEVPQRAISMSIQQILKSRNVICVVPEQRKAKAVRDCLELEVDPMRPASILQTHERTTIYLDQESASLLRHT
jgi:glucosamine-6-phosphate deaminase